MNSTSKKKVILLSAARTGSNLLTSLLSSHRNAYMYYEIFNLSVLDKNDLLDIAQSSTQYLRNKLEKSDREVVGFKLFYEHLKIPHNDGKWQKEQLQKNDRLKRILSDYMDLLSNNAFAKRLTVSFEKAWNHLSQDKSYYIIHLKRENKLDQLLSLKNAFKTDKWARTNYTPYHYAPMRLSVEECNYHFAKMEEKEIHFDNLFSKHRMLNITYEELFLNRESVLQNVMDFLGLRPQKLETHFSRQKYQSNSDLIENFDQLKKEYEGTRWEQYFLENKS